MRYDLIQSYHILGVFVEHDELVGTEGARARSERQARSSLRQLQEGFPYTSCGPKFRLQIGELVRKHILLLRASTSAVCLLKKAVHSWSHELLLT